MNLFSSKIAKKKAILAGILLLIFLSIFTFFMFPVIKYLLHPSLLKTVVSNYGNLAPFIFMLLIITQMLFLIIPGAPFIIAGGYLFGGMGAVYSILGTIIGSIILFNMGRIFGRPFVESIINKKIIDKLDYQTNNLEKTLFIIFLLPPLPHDIFSFVSGITNISLKNYIFIAFFGKLPLIMFYTFVGLQFSKLNIFYALLLLSIMVVVIVIIFFNTKKKERLHR